MPKPTRTEQANRDLLEIWVYIAEKSYESADRVMAEIDEKCRLLAESPGIGRRRDELIPGLRSFPVGIYVIYYRVAAGGIEVIRVLSGSRNITDLFPAS